MFLVQGTFIYKDSSFQTSSDLHIFSASTSSFVSIVEQTLSATQIEEEVLLKVHPGKSTVHYVNIAGFEYC